MTRRLLAAPLAAALALSAAGAARGDDAPAQPSAPPSGDRSSDEKAPAAPEDTWLDISHAFIGNALLAPVFRVDRFFSDERDLEVERSRSFLQWRNDLTFNEGASRPSLQTSVNASIRFPGVNKQLRRLQLVIVGEARDAVATLFPGQPATESTAPESGNADAGLRFALWDGLLTHADLGGGVIIHLPPGVFGRLRFRYAQPVLKLAVARFATSGFWRTDTRFGTSASVDVERPFHQRLLARAGSTAMLTETSRGIEWSADTALIATFNPRAGAQVGALVSGASRASPGIDQYRVYTRLRRDFFRRWLFFELEPAVAWPWSATLGRRAIWTVVLRLEVQFQGERPEGGPQARTAPDRAPEPRDPTPEAPAAPATGASPSLAMPG